VRLTAEIRVTVVLLKTLLYRHEMRALWILVRRCFVLMLVLMFVRVRMSMIVRMRMLQIAVLVRVLVGVHVIVRHVHSSLAGSLQPSPLKQRRTNEITSQLRTAGSP
jgi:hypothetical protein